MVSNVVDAKLLQKVALDIKIIILTYSTHTFLLHSDTEKAVLSNFTSTKSTKENREHF